MAADAEGEPGPPTHSIQSGVSERLNEGLSDGIEDGDNEPTYIQNDED